MNRTPSLIAAMCTVLLAIALAPAAADSNGEAPNGDALVAAAQRQDLARVKALLEAGTPVDSANRYGATALFYATEKGDVGMVKLLIEAGANVNVQDTFYSATPVGWALSEISDESKHREIVLLLLANGADQADAALATAVRLADVELLRAALATDKVTVKARRKALVQAESAKQEAIVAVLADGLPPAAAPAGSAKAIELTAEDRARYVGEYANATLAMRVKVFVDGEQLKAQPAGQPALTLDATGQDAFSAREQDGIDVVFAGRGGIVERFELSQGGQHFSFVRAEAEIEEEVVAAPLPEAKRAPAIDWPSFRGPGASGIGDGQGVPTAWDGEVGTNVRWKTPIPGIALSAR